MVECGLSGGDGVCRRHINRRGAENEGISGEKTAESKEEGKRRGIG